MRVDVDGLDRVMRSAAQGETAFADVPNAVRAKVAEAVNNERQSHRYTNRTGDAEKFTKARNVAGGAVAEMGVPYAQALNARGWSEFDVWMERADYEIRKAMDDLNGRL